jgi:hypothetical protein
LIIIAAITITCDEFRCIGAETIELEISDRKICLNNASVVEMFKRLGWTQVVDPFKAGVFFCPKCSLKQAATWLPKPQSRF